VTARPRALGYPLLNGVTHLAARLPSYVQDATDRLAGSALTDGRQQRELPPPVSGGSPCSDLPPRTAARGRGPAAPKQARAETSQDIPYEGLTAGIPLAQVRL
jgi:hypothetical protein